MMEVSLLEVDTVLIFERYAWPMGEMVLQATNERRPP